MKKINIKLHTVILFFVLFLATYCQPINRGVYRFLLIASIIIFITILFIYCWKKKTVRFILFVIFGIISLLLINPLKYEIKDYRQKYVINLLKYKGVQYLWGGEGKLGIDCSGLLRCAKIDTLRNEGLFSLNGYALRESIKLWWNDCTAKSLRDEYQEQTIKGKEYKNLLKIDYTTIKPGDFAVTKDGIHVMAYIGEKKWIHADPSNKIVSIENINVSKSPCLHIGIYVVKWADME